jgi:hypothetical protein
METDLPKSAPKLDLYCVFSTKEEAKKHYNFLLEQPCTYSANLTEVLESTDYAPKKMPKKSRYWVINTKGEGAMIVNWKPIVGIDGVTKIFWSGFREEDAQFQFNRLLNLGY